MADLKNSDQEVRLDKLKNDIQQAYRRAQRIKEDRAANNDDLQAALSDLETKGIPRKAFRMAMSYVNMDPDDRKGFDAAYSICREAMGLPVQGDLLDLIEPGPDGPMGEEPAAA